MDRIPHLSGSVLGKQDPGGPHHQDALLLILIVVIHDDEAADSGGLLAHGLERSVDIIPPHAAPDYEHLSPTLEG